MQNYLLYLQILEELIQIDFIITKQKEKFLILIFQVYLKMLMKLQLRNQQM